MGKCRRTGWIGTTNYPLTNSMQSKQHFKYWNKTKQNRNSWKIFAWHASYVVFFRNRHCRIFLNSPWRASFTCHTTTSMEHWTTKERRMRTGRARAKRWHHEQPAPTNQTVESSACRLDPGLFFLLLFYFSFLHDGLLDSVNKGSVRRDEVREKNPQPFLDFLSVNSRNKTAPFGCIAVTSAPVKLVSNTLTSVTFAVSSLPSFFSSAVLSFMLDILRPDRILQPALGWHLHLFCK